MFIKNQCSRKRERIKKIIMADITKCKGGNCNMKESCYRFTAKDSEYRQSYFSELPINKDGSCDMYWDKNQENILNQLKNITNGKR